MAATAMIYRVSLCTLWLSDPALQDRMRCFDFHSFIRFTRSNECNGNFTIALSEEQTWTLGGKSKDRPFEEVMSSHTIPWVLRRFKVPNSNKWYGPKISGRDRAMLRKRAILNGRYLRGAKLEEGGWDPRWDNQRKVVVAREPKLKKHLRDRDERVARIEAALATMDDDIERHHDERRLMKPRSGRERLLLEMGIVKPRGEVLPKSKKGKR